MNVYYTWEALKTYGCERCRCVNLIHKRGVYFCLKTCEILEEKISPAYIGNGEYDYSKTSPFPTEHCPLNTDKGV